MIFNKSFIKFKYMVMINIFFFSENVYSQKQTITPRETCILQQFAVAKDNLTIAEIRQTCDDFDNKMTEQRVKQITSDEETKTEIPLGIISKRIITERDTQFNPFVLTPHKMNYILPVYTTSGINKTAYEDFGGFEDNLEDIEAKFQISFKVPLNTRSLITEGDGLYLGFTLQAWWQIYSHGISKPFRETNYQPEIFYLTPLNWHPFKGNTGLVLGLEHQSNGRSQILSRSWNRVYANFLYEKHNFAFSLKPWIRLTEDEKEFDLDPEGDDNPDIEDFMGHFELGMTYQWDKLEIKFLGRENFSTNKGFAKLDFTFPMWGRLKGFITASNGYGGSLIDYNYRQTRIGIGIALNDIL